MNFNCVQLWLLFVQLDAELRPSGGINNPESHWILLWNRCLMMGGELRDYFETFGVKKWVLSSRPFFNLTAAVIRGADLHSWMFMHCMSPASWSWGGHVLHESNSTETRRGKKWGERSSMLSLASLWHSQVVRVFMGKYTLALVMWINTYKSLF